MRAGQQRADQDQLLRRLSAAGSPDQGLRPQKLTDEPAREAQLLVTMGCGERCPVVPGLRPDDWPLEDPKGKPVERVRQIRDEVRERVAALLRQEGWAAAGR